MMAVIAVTAGLHLWNYHNSEPWTRDARVRGNVIQVSSDIAGLVTDVLVSDNQVVKKGQVLFKVDTARQNLDVEQAQADVLQAQATLAESRANLAQAQADLIKSQANIHLADQNAKRYASLLDGAVSKQEQDQIFAAQDQAHAEHIQAQAAIEQARANIAK